MWFGDVVYEKMMRIFLKILPLGEVMKRRVRNIPTFH
jgi:hypothetical protein